MAEGRIPYGGFETWYREEGETAAGKLPVLCLHGGPGASHDYIEPLFGLAATGRRTVLYDQIGCGRSSIPARALDWTVELFVEEVAAVREALGLDRVHIFGNSWGGMLALEVAISGAPEACTVFYRRHVCRVWPFPDHVDRSFANLGEVYETMNGPSEFHVIGTLREWSVVDRLGEIGVPALVVSGEHDEAPPAINRTVSEGIPGAVSVILEGCSHMAHVEDTAGYLALLDRFFSRVESST